MIKEWLQHQQNNGIGGVYGIYKLFKRNIIYI